MPDEGAAIGNRQNSFRLTGVLYSVAKAGFATPTMVTGLPTVMPESARDYNSEKRCTHNQSL